MKTRVPIQAVLNVANKSPIFGGYAEQGFMLQSFLLGYSPHESDFYRGRDLFLSKGDALAARRQRCIDSLHEQLEFLNDVDLSKLSDQGYKKILEEQGASLEVMSIDDWEEYKTTHSIRGRKSADSMPEPVV